MKPPSGCKITPLSPTISELSFRCAHLHNSSIATSADTLAIPNIPKAYLSYSKSISKAYLKHTKRIGTPWELHRNSISGAWVTYHLFNPEYYPAYPIHYPQTPPLNPYYPKISIQYLRAHMRIAVNTRLLLKGRLEGIGWYTHQMLERIVRAHPEHEFIFFFDRPYDKSFIFGSNVTPVVVHPQARHALLFYLWFEWSIPAMLRKYKADLFLSTDGLCSLSTKVPTCLVMHDLAFEHYPEHLKLSHRLYLKHWSPRFARKAKRIVTVSEYSRKDIAERYRIYPEKIDVTYNGANPAYQPLTWEDREAVKKEYTNGQEYFVFAGALHPRKNVVALLQAFIKFKRHHRSPIKLVIVGRMAWKFKELAALRETMAFKEDVVWAGYMNVDLLSKVIGAAYALVYPSLFEGFGIPILEALKCGVPAVVSNTSSMPEVAGDAALLVDPTNVEDIAAKMGVIYKDEAVRSRLVAATAEQAAKFDWDHSAPQLWESMMKCLKK